MQYLIQEELVIDLTSSEKSTLIRFLGLYLGSSFILMLFIAFFYFQNEQRLYLDLTKSNMQNLASKISSKIIYSHMSGTVFNKAEVLTLKSYNLSFYNDKKEKLFGNLDEDIDFSKTLYEKKNSLILVDKSTWGHLGIDFIVIQDTTHFKIIKDLKVTILTVFLFVYLIISIIGFYLAQLFLKPIRNEREKLNNFIKDTTHELNTPISAILMSTENDNLSEKQIQRIRLSAKRISEVYKDLTYVFLKKKEEKTIEKLNLKTVLEEQLEYFKILASKKRLEVDIKLEDLEYDMNRDDFIRVINNLISNAIKYNKVGGKLNIYLEKGNLQVQDTGIGIDQKKLDDVFKRYYRGTSQEGGFGIGLSIVSFICQKYNIKIDVKSKENFGTTFILKF